MESCQQKNRRKEYRSRSKTENEKKSKKPSYAGLTSPLFSRKKSAEKIRDKYKEKPNAAMEGRVDLLSYKQLNERNTENPRSKPKPGTFTERLNRYKELLFEVDNTRYKEHIRQFYHLEESWNQVIKEDVYMTRKLKVQQQSIWEFLTTERNYIKKLRLIVEVFQQCFKICQSESDLLEIKEKDIFGNINEILLVNDELWTVHLIKVLNRVRATHSIIRPSQLLEIFYQFEQLFQPYVKFCLMQDACLKNIREKTDASATQAKNFKEYIKWCESLRQCGRFKLADLMTEPMQRLTRYPLLLKKIMKETKDQKEVEFLDVVVTKVERFISNINETLRKRYENEKLQKCLDQFEYFSTMEAANEEVKWTAIDFLKLNVPNLQEEEQRCILKQGHMKLIEKRSRNEFPVVGFLFTDVFLLGKYKKSTNKIRIIKQLFFLDKIKLIKSEVSETSIVFVYLDEFGLLSTTFMLDLYEKERGEWITSIEKAKLRYQNARSGYGSTLEFFQDANFTQNDISSGTSQETKKSSRVLSSADVDVALAESLLPVKKTANWLLGNTAPSENKDNVSKLNRTENNAEPIHGNETKTRLRNCNSVPDLVNLNLTEELSPKLKRKTNSMRCKILKSELKDDFIISEPTFEEDLLSINKINRQKIRSESSASSESFNSKSLDNNNNVQHTSKIRHLIYGRIDFAEQGRSHTLKPNMRLFKTVSTQTESEILMKQNNDYIEMLPQNTSLSGIDEGIDSELLYNDVIFSNNAMCSDSLVETPDESDISFSYEPNESYFEEDYFKNC